MPKVYLAGPDVFHPEAVTLGRRKQEICADHGLTGLFPLDADLSAHAPSDPGPSLARAIFQANEAMIGACDGVLANLVPFRGPNVDDGTAYEIGVAAALGKPVIGYAALPRGMGGLLPQRTAHAWGPLRDVSDAVRRRQQVDRDGLQVEDFGLPVNLMLACAIERQGGRVVCTETRCPDPYEDMGPFLDAVRAMAVLLADQVRP